MSRYSALAGFSLAVTLTALAAFAAACSAESASPPSDYGTGGSGANGSGASGSGAGAGASGVAGAGAAPAGSGGMVGQGGTSAGGTSAGGAAGATGSTAAGGNAGSSAGATGAAGSGQGGTGAAVTFSQIRTLIPGTCGGALCHTGRQQPSFANDANLHRTLLDTAVDECGGARLVVPGDPQGSAIIRLVNRQCTKDGMPFYMPDDCESNPCLPSAQIRTITSWIQAGAPGP